MNDSTPHDDSMHDEWHVELPLYVAGTLPHGERAALEDHLDRCEVCRVEVREWQLLARVVQRETEARHVALPPLSPVVRVNLYRHLTLREAMRSAVHLTAAQWPVLRGMLPAAVLVLAIGTLGTIALRDDLQVALPLLALAPIVAALSVAFLHHTEADPAWEVLAATPTSPGALVFARLTLITAAIVAVMLGGSVAVSIATGEMLGPLVTVWLGPLLLLSALATVLAVRWTAVIGAGISLALWVTVISVLLKELAGDPFLAVSLRPLLDPGWLLCSGYLIAAALLWYLAWRLASSQLVLVEKLN